MIYTRSTWNGEHYADPHPKRESSKAFLFGRIVIRCYFLGSYNSMPTGAYLLIAFLSAVFQSVSITEILGYIKCHISRRAVEWKAHKWLSQSKRNTRICYRHRNKST